MLSPWSYVRGFERLSLCDWPGRNVCVLFLGGCNLRCPTCHNHDLAWRPDILPLVPRQEIEAYIRFSRKWLDGIVITGGEPTEVPDIHLLLQDLAKWNLPIKMDTNGMRPLVVEQILTADAAQAFSVDVKGPYNKYPALTGNCVDADWAEANLHCIFSLAHKHPHAFLFRTTMVPALTAADLDTARSYVPEGFTLTFQQYVEPRRSDALIHPQTRRPAGNLVHAQDSTRNIESTQSQRSERPALGQAACG